MYFKKYTDNIGIIQVKGRWGNLAKKSKTVIRKPKKGKHLFGQQLQLTTKQIGTKNGNTVFLILEIIFIIVSLHILSIIPVRQKVSSILLQKKIMQFLHSEILP